MKRPLAFFGGLLVILGVVLSIFFNILGWWNFNVTVLFPDRWFNAFGGLSWDNTVQNYFNDDSVIEMIPGVIAAVGGLMLITQSRFLGLLGGMLVFVAIGIFAYNMLQYDLIVDFAELMGGNIFWWEESVFSIKMGYGLMMSAGGSLIGMIGCISKKD